MDQNSIYGFLSKHENFAAHFNPFRGTPVCRGTQFGKPWSIPRVGKVFNERATCENSKLPDSHKLR